MKHLVFIFNLFMSLTILAAPADDFVITVQTNVETPFAIDPMVFKILTDSDQYNYNYNVDCNDDGINEGNALSGDYTCQYAIPGNYTIRIKDNSGSKTGFPKYNMGESSFQAIKITSLDQWGTGVWLDMHQSFAHAFNMKIMATDMPNLLSTYRISFMFRGASLADPDVSHWNLQGVTDMLGLFGSATAANPDVSAWDVSSVTNMNWMFGSATAANPDVSAWNVSSVTDMNWMFGNAISANPDVSHWDVSSVTDMGWLFDGAISAKPDVSDWDVSSVVDMSRMFRDAKTANPDVSNWNVTSVTDMASMFNGAVSAKPDVSDWDVSSVTDMASMFNGAVSAQPDVSDWNVSSVTSMNSMFSGTTFSNPNVSQWDVSSVTDMGSMFGGSVSTALAYKNFDVLSASDITSIVNGVVTANPEVSNWDVSSVTNMSWMFAGATSAKPDVSQWDVSSVTNMSYMFINATSAVPDISDWDVSKVTAMDGMFEGITLPPWLYDEILLSFNQQDLQSDVIFSGGNSNYCMAETSRAELIENDGWTVTDGGLNCGADLSLHYSDYHLSQNPDDSQLELLITNTGYQNVIDAQLTTLFSGGHNNLKWACEVMVGQTPCSITNGMGNLSESINLSPGDQLRYMFSFDISGNETISSTAHVQLIESDIYPSDNQAFVSNGVNVLKSTSGAWYDSENPGHGIFLEVLAGADTSANERLNMYWFTHHNLKPIWIYGNAEIIEGQPVVIDLIKTEGTLFPPDFNAEDVQSSNWGRAVLNFKTPHAMTLNWSAGLDFGSGMVKFTQLSKVSESANGCLSGSFYNPNQPGHGLYIHITDVSDTQRQINISWFTYHNDEQLWLVGSGLLNTDGTANVSLIQLKGASFFDPNAENGWSFNQEDIVNTMWGSLNLSYADTNNLEIEYSPNDTNQFQTGQIDMTRLTVMQGFSCDAN